MTNLVNSKSLAVFDLDEVLAHLRSGMQNALQAKTGKLIEWCQWDTYDLGEIFGLSLDDCIDAFVEHRILETCVVEPFAREALSAARDAGYEVIILTARGWHPSGLTLTEWWLQEHRLPHDALHVVQLDTCKGAYLQGLGRRVDYFFDDSPRHILASKGIARHPVVIDRPWNSRLSGVARVSCLSQVVEIFR